MEGFKDWAKRFAWVILLSIGIGSIVAWWVNLPDDPSGESAIPPYE